MIKFIIYYQFKLLETNKFVDFQDNMQINLIHTYVVILYIFLYLGCLRIIHIQNHG